MGLEYTEAEIHRGLEYIGGSNTKGTGKQYQLMKSVDYSIIFTRLNASYFSIFKYNDLLCETITHTLYTIK